MSTKESADISTKPVAISTTPSIHHLFSNPLLAWFAKHGRKNLPWQNPRQAYAVWISEIMLQQTQVQTVIPYFLKFMSRFPTVETLAEAQEDQVLSLWAGLGYYSRARNLHKTAKIINRDYQGLFPEDMHLLQLLPGIGESTAAAIASQAFNQPVPILDANVKRILARYFQIKGHPENSLTKKHLWEQARYCMPAHDAADYTQAIMDLGALICKSTQPLCEQCPLQKSCLSCLQATTHLYPEKKEKKKLPTRQLQFLVLHNAHNQIYLEKRPAEGIWGSLWCLPHLESGLYPLPHLANQYGMTGEEPKVVTQFKHSFTHYHLILQVASIFIQDSSRDLEGQWFSEADIQHVGLPKPIQTIVFAWFNK